MFVMCALINTIIESRRVKKVENTHQQQRRADDVIDFSLSPPSKLKDEREKTAIYAFHPPSIGL
jgi:hypothetical protein